MPRDVRPDHFRTGVWAPAGPLRLRHHTCLACGTRLKTWVSFQAHRRVCDVDAEHLQTPPSTWTAPPVRDPRLVALIAAARAEEAGDAEEALDPGRGPALDGVPLGALGSDLGSPRADARQTPAGARR